MKSAVSVLMLVFQCSGLSAETIYQWSDPWGQIQYSKIPVPGAMVSDLSELPEQSETTEQQKQEAMLKKLQRMRQDNVRFAEMEAVQQATKIQAKETRDQCGELQRLAADIEFARLRQFSMTVPVLMPNYYIFLQNDISREIRQRCR